MMSARRAAFALLLAALGLAGFDLLHNGRLLTPLGMLWFDAHRASLEALQRAALKTWPAGWEYVIAPLLRVPAVLFLLIPGAELWAAHRRRETGRRSAGT